MSEQVSIYERRLASGKGAYKEECMKLREEVALLQEENSALQYEIDNLNKVASYVGSRVAKVLVGARRANNYNSSLVAELKRWNRKLEVKPLRWSERTVHVHHGLCTNDGL
jgi:predicted RNase H-like nuclease (RuvC/YqgF family)